MFDTRTRKEKCFVRVEAMKDAGGSRYHVHVDNGSRIIKDLSPEQAEAVVVALRLAQSKAIDNALYKVRYALGLETE